VQLNKLESVSILLSCFEYLNIYREIYLYIYIGISIGGDAFNKFDEEEVYVFQTAAEFFTRSARQEVFIYT
jgi:hypothetical protein